MNDEADARRMYAQFLLDDTAARAKYQHEFALSGFKTLVLINGGAIIALLTYAGNAESSLAAGSLRYAFLWYVIGLTSTTLAYVFSYFSQGLFLFVSARRADLAIHRPADASEDTPQDKRNGRRGFICIGFAVVLTLIGLSGFICGSVMAMRALI